MDWRDERKRTADEASKLPLTASKPEARGAFGISVAATYLLAMRRAVCRWRDSNLGSGTELGNSSGNGKRKPYKWEPRRGKVSMCLKGADHPAVVLKLL